MHHLSNDPEVEVTSAQLEKFADEHGGPIEFDNAANTAHWDHPNLPVRYVARLEEPEFPVDSTTHTLPDGRTVIGKDAYEAEIVKAVFGS